MARITRYFLQKFNRADSSGFTLIEMIVTFGIIAILSTILIAKFRYSSDTVTARNQVASKIIADIRRAQSIALAPGTRPVGGQPSKVCGAGIHQDDDAHYYIYYRLESKLKLVNSSYTCNTGSGTVSRNYNLSYDDLEKIEIGNPGLNLDRKSGKYFDDIFFEPPSPKTYIDNKPDATETTDFRVKARSANNCNGNICAKITIRTTGVIDLYLNSDGN